jgi:hypothetical protein
MERTERLDKKSLLERLDNYKLIFEVNSDLPEEDRLLREQINHKFWMIDSRLNELNILERANDQSNYDFSLDEANRILDALKELIEQLLGDNVIPIDDNFENLA